MKVTVMTADEQILTLDVDPDESVSLPTACSQHLHLNLYSGHAWPVSLNSVMNPRVELEKYGILEGVSPRSERR
jgi:hypothetical protein